MFKWTHFVFLTFILCAVLFLSRFYLTQNSMILNHLSSTIYRENKKDKMLVVLVLSYMKGKTQRDAIRQTWMKKYRENVSEVFVKFSIGTEGLSSQDMKNLNLEDATYDDLLLLPHLHDSYSNLTRKVLQSFVALDKCCNFSYLLKCDDDTFVNMEAILSELKQRSSNQKYYWGYYNKKAKVRKVGKWEEKKWFLCKTYLPYAEGGGYILSHDLIRRITASSVDLTLYNNEDVSIGTWLSPFEIERHHDERFHTRQATCSKSRIISTENNVEMMFAVHKSLDNGKGICLK